MATRKKVRTRQPKPKSSMEAKDEEEDRISNLPQSLLLLILSFLDTRSAIQTSVVSRSWNNLWLSVDTLRLSPETSPDHSRRSSDFVAGVLDRRNSSASHLRHLQFRLPRPLDTSRCLDQNSPTFARVLKFAADRNCRSFELGHVNFVCLDVASFLPNVTALHLEHVTFRSGVKACNRFNVFSNCPNLEDLSLISCIMDSSEAFEISCPKLAKLRIEHPFMFHSCYNLKCKLVVSSPELRTLQIVDISPFPLTVESDSLHCVSLSVNLCYWDDREINYLMKMLQELSCAKHLELSMLVLQGLSSDPLLLRNQRFRFHNLKSLKLRSNMSCWNFEVPDHVMDFLLGDSPSAKVIFSK